MTRASLVLAFASFVIGATLSVLSGPILLSALLGLLANALFRAFKTRTNTQQ